MRGVTAERARAVEEESIVKWPYTDHWGGASITEGSARAQSNYAKEMFAAAMRGRLELFDPPKQITGD